MYVCIATWHQPGYQFTSYLLASYIVVSTYAIIMNLLSTFKYVHNYVDTYMKLEFYRAICLHVIILTNLFTDQQSSEEWSYCSTCECKWHGSHEAAYAYYIQLGWFSVGRSHICICKIYTYIKYLWLAWQLATSCFLF